MDIAKADLLDISVSGSHIRAFSTLRTAEDPSLPYSGFSVCHYTGDDIGHVAACREALAKELHIDAGQLIIPRQTHSANVAIIDSIAFDQPQLEDTDALVTCLDDVALCINTADCVPIVMADAEAGVIAVAHSGWRGTAARIAALTVEKMTRLGAVSERITAAMGPSICRECFEVGEEVADVFRKEFGHQTVREAAPRPFVDLPLAIALTLEQAGVPAANISMPHACSHCRPDLYFSARRLGIASGRTLTLIIRRKA